VCYVFVPDGRMYQWVIVRSSVRR